MKVFPDKLPEALGKSLPPVVIVAGDEPLLHRDACDEVRRVARERGVEEREVLHVENGFQWGRLTESAASLSLFATSKLIELRLGDQAPGQEGGKALEAYAAQAGGSDDVLLITAGRLDRRQQQSKWFKALDKLGLFVPVWPVDHARLGFWMRDRAGRHGLQLDMDAARLLGERTEGNLLAADQELQKLALLHPPGARLGVEAIAGGVEDNARFDVFTLTDACLRGERERAVRIVRGLRGEGIEAPVVLWALTREMRTLLSLRQHLDQGQSLEHACKAQRPMIPEKRRPNYQQALQRLPHRRLHKLLLFAQRIDQAIKGGLPLPVWDGLNDLALTLAGGRGLLAEMPQAYRSA
ncbi:MULTISPECIES: DNA polymerase III subunit delta [Modicisalibacter]|uniref:DNA polymerase III subunit delta n=1 Tax=Modicisalibacter TaxID=574347 RepID=UPI00100B5781|nr:MULTISPECIES: DNA polymerase III subunit delta [Halomonadaceae]MBZ9556475.1 DNA polymerase III subunit delta [Modicisalibacter sp. R2A 31.J]MBZ9575056.1 DNA polymerase III subunit delta [Modicisalibacter sp. MOD 31.J]